MYNIIYQNILILKGVNMSTIAELGTPRLKEATRSRSPECNALTNLPPAVQDSTSSASLSPQRRNIILAALSKVGSFFVAIKDFFCSLLSSVRRVDTSAFDIDLEGEASAVDNANTVANTVYKDLPDEIINNEALIEE